MIYVRLFGGAKRSFLTDKLSVDRQEMSVSDLLVFLQNSAQKDGTAFDSRNVLIAVNGVDSSAMQGMKTTLKDGDIVSIIPVVHGGGKPTVRFGILGYEVELARTGKLVNDPIELLEKLRENFPDVTIQGIRAKYILNVLHARRIIGISLAARGSGTMLSNKVETDLLMRFAGSRQISDSIKKAGLRRGEESILIAVGLAPLPREFLSEIRGMAKPFLPFLNNSSFLKKEFGVTKKELGCVMSKEPLEDILVERAAVLLQ